MVIKSYTISHAIIVRVKLSELRGKFRSYINILFQFLIRLCQCIDYITALLSTSHLCNEVMRMSL